MCFRVTTFYITLLSRSTHIHSSTGKEVGDHPFIFTTLKTRNLNWHSGFHANPNSSGEYKREASKEVPYAVPGRISNLLAITGT